MNDLIVGAGLVLVFEGLLWALAPHLAIKFLKAASETPEQSLRTAGLLCVVLGFVLVWVIRG